MKKVSVIIPCYNAAAYIDRCLNSLEAQTFGIENMEIILVDDFSVDETYSRMLRFEEKYPENVLVISCKENGGPGAARNIGLNYAMGEYVVFVDADDIADTEMIEKMCGTMEEYNVDIVECSYKSFSDGEKLFVEKRDSDRLMGTGTPEDRGKLILNFFRTAVWGRLYKKSFLEENKLSFPEMIIYGEDNFFSGMGMLLCSSCYHIGDTLYYYYQNDSGLIRNKNDNKRVRQLADIMELYLAELNERGFLDGEMAGYGAEFEWYMIYKYFMDPVSFVISRQMQNWKDEVAFFKKELLKYFPDAARNPYLIRDKRWTDYVWLLKNDNY